MDQIEQPESTDREVQSLVDILRADAPAPERDPAEIPSSDAAGVVPDTQSANDSADVTVETGTEAVQVLADDDARATAAGARWHVIYAYATQEDDAHANILIAGDKLGDEVFFGAEVPTETVRERVRGKVESVRKPLMPGYLLMRVVPKEEHLGVLRLVEGVRKIVGVISDDEADRLLGRNKKAAAVEERAVSAIPFRKGDEVMVVAGIFKDQVGRIDSVDEARYRVKVLIDIFGAQTPVTMDPDHVVMVRR